jgi:hypothetical protein
VNHLHVVTSTGFTDPVTARFAVGLGSSFLENLLDVWPSSVGTTEHEGRTMTGAFLTTGNTTPDEEEALGFEFLGSTDGIRVVRASSVNDDITLLKVWDKLLDEIINSRSGLDEQDNFAGLLELGAELLKGMSALDFSTCYDGSRTSKSRLKFVSS